METYAELGQKEKDIQLLSQAFLLVDKVNDELSKVRTLSQIAQAYSSFGEKENVAQLLTQSLYLAEKIDDVNHKCLALNYLAVAYANTGARAHAIELLNQAALASEEIDNVDSRIEVIRKISQNYENLGKKSEAARLFYPLAEKLSGVSRTMALVDSAKFYAKYGEFAGARRCALKMTSRVDEAKTLALILEIWAKSKNPRLADEVSKVEE